GCQNELPRAECAGNVTLCLTCCLNKCMSSILSLVNDEQSLRAYRTAALTAQTPHLLKQQLDAAFITPNRLGMFQDLGGSEPEALLKSRNGFFKRTPGHVLLARRLNVDATPFIGNETRKLRRREKILVGLGPVIKIGVGDRGLAGAAVPASKTRQSLREARVVQRFTFGGRIH